MNAKTAAVLLTGWLAACAPTPSPQAAATPAPHPAAGPGPAPPPAPAPAPAQATKPLPADRVVNIQLASCQDLLHLSPADRDAASMFYIGYQASHFRARTINVGLIPSIEDQALTYCAENPDRAVAQAFAQAYLQTR